MIRNNFEYIIEYINIYLWKSIAKINYNSYFKYKLLLP